MLRYGHMKMPSRFRLILSLVATGHDAVTRCWGTFVKLLLRPVKDHQYNSDEGKLKKVQTMIIFFFLIE